MNGDYTLKNISFPPKLRTKLIRIRRKPYSRNSVVSSSQQQSDNSKRILVDNPSKLKIETVPYKGRGITATDWFKKGDFVVRYVGELISRSEGLKRDDHLNSIESDDSFLYFFSYNTTRYCLDATRDDGSFGRLVNHSRLRPNCRAQSTLINGEPALVLVAKRDILPDEEILYDYGDIDPETLAKNPWLENS